MAVVYLCPAAGRKVSSQQCGKGAGAGLNSLPLCTLCASLGAQCCAAVLHLSCFFIGIQIWHPKCTQLVQWELYFISVVKKVDSKIRAVQMLVAQVSGLQPWGILVCSSGFFFFFLLNSLSSGLDPVTCSLGWGIDPHFPPEPFYR